MANSQSSEPSSNVPAIPDASSAKDRLAGLIAQASAKEAIKDHDAAAELYSQATELQATINGEMSVDNAEILYAYGKSLYNVAVRNSDVLGSKVAGETPAQTKAPSGRNETVAGEDKNGSQLVADAVARGSSAGASNGTPEGNKNQGTPFFQFTGDENFDDSDSDEDNENNEVDQGAGEEETEDDFANAYETLDLARVLLLRKLEQLQHANTEDKDTSIRRTSERLADTYDLLAEISLEGERFSDAVTDLRAALEIKSDLFPLEEPTVAECHYKLSLALEFSSVAQKDGETGDSPQAKVDEGMRKEAAKHMEIAIDSCGQRIASEEQRLTTITDEEKIAQMKSRIAEVKDIVSDMKQRLVELHRPPVSVAEARGDADDANLLQGFLKDIVNKPHIDKLSLLQEATKGANDLSGLVRKKNQNPAMSEQGPSSPSKSEGKRQLEEDGESETSKKPKVENSDTGL